MSAGTDEVVSQANSAAGILELEPGLLWDRSTTRYREDRCMRKVALCVIRGLGIVLVLALIPIAFAPSGSARNPYVSALSTVISDAFADPDCNNKTCDTNNTCTHASGFQCVSQGTKCGSGPC